MNKLRTVLISLILIVLAITAYSTGVVLNTVGNVVQNPVQERNDAFEVSAQNNYHWDHMPLTYNYGSCFSTFETRLAKDIDKAFDFIEDRTDDVLSFQKVSETEDADITFRCDIGQGDRSKGTITTASALSYLYTGTNVYASGEISVYETYECLGERPTMMIHEVGHLLGLDHNEGPSYSGDIMHPFIRDNCDADFLEKDVEFLKEIYR